MNPQQMLMDAFSQQGGGDPLFGKDPLDDIGVLTPGSKRDPLPDIGQLSKGADAGGGPNYGRDPLADIGQLSQNADGNQEFGTEQLVQMLMQMIMGR
jgi:hypothetical protein